MVVIMPIYYPEQPEIRDMIENTTNDLLLMVALWGKLPSDELRERLNKAIAALLRARKKIDSGWVID